VNFFSEFTKAGILDETEMPFDFIAVPLSNDTSSYHFKTKEEVFIIANTGSGGCYLKRMRDGKIFYISSEGENIFVAQNSEQLLELIVQYPYWVDMIRFSVNVNYSSYYEAHLSLKEERIEFVPNFLEIQSKLIKLYNISSPEIVLRQFIQTLKAGTDLEARSTVDNELYDALT